MQVVAFARKRVVLFDADVHVKVSGGAAALAHFALLVEADAGVVVHACGHIDRNGALRAHTAMALA